MIEGIPRISVLVITYKQENIISRALDALIEQKDYIYEICVSDDCSPDGTWNVLRNYQLQYPDLIKIHRNEKNVGIFENFEQVWAMPTGDIVNMMAGDDEPGEDWFKSVVKYIQEKNVDYKNELFCIYGDHLVLYGNGDQRRVRNTAIDKRPNDALRLALRGMISNRGCCFSISVLKKFDKVSQGRSHIAEHIQDRLIQINSEKNYYIANISNKYYAGVGVSTRINETIYKERQEILPYTESYLEGKGIQVCKKDKLYHKYARSRGDFRRYRRVGDCIKMFWYYFTSIDLTLPYDKEKSRQVLFAVLRRLPHKNPVIFK